MAKTQKQARMAREKRRDLVRKTDEALVWAANKKEQKVQEASDHIRTVLKKTWSEHQAKLARQKSGGILKRTLNWLFGRKGKK